VAKKPHAAFAQLQLLFVQAQSKTPTFRQERLKTSIVVRFGFCIIVANSKNQEIIRKWHKIFQSSRKFTHGPLKYFRRIRHSKWHPQPPVPAKWCPKGRQK
jgi:hypothetical protein